MDSRNVSGGIILVDVSYNSVEFPVGIRHYFFLSDKSKLFINASQLFDIDFDSMIEFQRADGSEFDSALEIRRERHWVFGIGFKTLDRFSLELRYEGNRNNLERYAFWVSDYETVSINFWGFNSVIIALLNYGCDVQ